MSERAKLTRKEAALLAPFGRDWNTMANAVENRLRGKTDAEMRAVWEATGKLTETNCGWDTYGVRDELRTAICREQSRRSRAPTPDSPAPSDTPAAAYTQSPLGRDHVVVRSKGGVAFEVLLPITTNVAVAEEWAAQRNKAATDGWTYSVCTLTPVGIPPVAPRGWQPIETAPKDEFVLACWGGPLALYAVGWNDALERWEDMTGEAHQPPTHWMPLPAPPAAFVRQGGREL